MKRLMVVVAALFAGGLAGAQSVSLSGSMGERALLVIDGAPKMLAIGASHRGVKLVSVGTNEAVVEIGGKRATLALGGAQVDLGSAGGAGGGTRIVLTAGPGGHFMAGGSINGRAVQFMVDTGATSVAIGQAEADRLGINYKNGPRGLAQTANGQVMVYRAMLDSVRVGDVTVYNVEAVVAPMPMGHVLLGNSFLTRFQMKRENDLMTLDRRF